MAITAEQVFTSAMVLMDQSSEDGTFNGYPDDYKTKSWSILTLLQSELLNANETPSIITSKDNSFTLDDRTCLTILPYGLAAHLLLTEDPQRASFFNNRYDELKIKRPTTIEKIQDVYNILPCSSTDTSNTGTGTSTDTTTVIDGGEV